MPGKLFFVHNTGEINDLLTRSRCKQFEECMGRYGLFILKFTFAAHGMNKVIGCINIIGELTIITRLQEVCFYHFNRIVVFTVKAPFIPHTTNYMMTLFQQNRYQSLSYVTVRAR